ncbi:MAG: hypothetical protein H7320_13515 [Ferruginibacter sp.]|nr:hypothetical protein [Ferruginibacter sp.]
MMQPFVLFEKKYLDKLIQLNKMYLVTQSYSRAYDHFANHTAVDLLITDYDDPGLAGMHLNAVKKDKYASIIRLDSDAHKTKLLEMMAGNQYRLFWSVVLVNADTKKRLEAYKDKIRKYIDTSTNWQVKGNDAVNFEGIEVTFGELFVTLKWRTQKRRVKFEEIEKS